VAGRNFVLWKWGLLPCVPLSHLSWQLNTAPTSHVRGGALTTLRAIIISIIFLASLHALHSAILFEAIGYFHALCLANLALHNFKTFSIFISAQLDSMA
jgi:hypothetical protein